MMHWKKYPPDWPEIAKRVKDAAGWRCVRCNAESSVEDRTVLTVHHMDGDRMNNRWWNLLALCQRCHLSVQNRVDPETPYWLEHSEWFKPYIAGYYAWKYLAEELTREETAARMEELLALERRA